MQACPKCGHENSDSAKFCEECAAPLAAHATAREQRKTVTVLFCDVTGSTSLGESTDPEALRALLARYFERMKGIVESHGGTVEKFIGDAVMAVFGVPQVHEDDALRAVRASVEMRDALPELGVQARIGLNTGEVVTGTEERLATGDAVNVAARLEQAARPGEILIGEATLALVRDAVDAEPVEPLDLKGKARPVSAFRVLAVAESSRRHEVPMVGRERELDRLRDAFGQAVADRSCQLFTVLGSAGVGKSRLAYEFLNRIDANVVRGRCLSYGEGITYWPVVEVLTHLGIRPEETSAATAIAALLGESEAATTPDEIAWAVRKTLERAAAEEPLVVVFDDIHWAEPAFLDLIEHVADFSRGAPILLLCIARAELLERREGWGGGKVNATAVLLEPLSGAETGELIERLGHLDEGLRERIREAAEGNPLFVEEMLAMVREAGNGEVAIPPTIQALLAARIDQLDAAERAVLERGAVEGKVFHRGAVEALAPEEAEVRQRLMSLVRKELLRPDTSMLAGDDAFRFRHLLIRDAAYDALPKAERADLHERFALWLEAHGADLVELDEILGYHLEQAARYLAELGLPENPALQEAARRRLTSAGRRAALRGDQHSAVSLFGRAAALVPVDEIELALEIELIYALFGAGRGDEALERAGELTERGRAQEDRIAELCGRIKEGWVRVFLAPEGVTEQLEATIEEALPVFEAAGNHVALCAAHVAQAQVANMRGRMDSLLSAFEQAASHAQQAGLPYKYLGWRAMGRYFGATPASELIAWLDAQEAHGAQLEWATAFRALGLAMLGDFEEGRAVLAKKRAELVERGAGMELADSFAFHGAELEFFAGEYAAAVREGTEGCKLFEEFGERSFLSTAAGILAQAHFALAQFDEAESWAGRARELGSTDDVATQMLWRQVQAKVSARRGELAEGERLAREAVEIGEKTDMFNLRGDAAADLGEVLSLAGSTDEATAAFEQSLQLFQRKENLAMVAQVHKRYEALRSQVP